MLIKMSNDNHIPIDSEAYYEELASQEELYLEETEEEVVAILTSYVSTASQNHRSVVTGYCEFRQSALEVRESLTVPNNDPRIAESRDEQLVDASEELITGDADDPPLSEETVDEMLSDSPVDPDLRIDR